MKGYIIYHKYEAEKNSSFIEMFKQQFSKYNIKLDYISYEDYINCDLPDFIINRTRDYRVSRWYENKKVKTFHSAYITYIGNNKYETIRSLEKKLPDEIKARKWTADTEFISSDEVQVLPGSYNEDVGLNKWMMKKKFVLKSVDGHGGSQVYLIENKSNKVTNIEKHVSDSLSGHDCIVQEYIESNGRDIRVYVVGGEIYSAVLREGGRDFRSNYSLGGTVSEYKLSSSQKSYIQKFIDALGGSGLGMAGIDFIPTEKGELLFNELEEMVGSRMLYKCTDYDIVRDYVKWLQFSITHTK